MNSIFNNHRINQDQQLLVADLTLFLDADTQMRIRKYSRRGSERYRALLRTLKTPLRILKGLEQETLNPCFFNGAEGGSRTPTVRKNRRILNPLRLPIPPLRL